MSAGDSPKLVFLIEDENICAATDGEFTTAPIIILEISSKLWSDSYGASHKPEAEAYGASYMDAGRHKAVMSM